jgi:hypothetical protein
MMSLSRSQCKIEPGDASAACQKSYPFIFGKPIRYEPELTTMHLPPSSIRLERAVVRARCDIRQHIDLSQRRTMQCNEVLFIERGSFLSTSQKIQRFDGVP